MSLSQIILLSLVGLAALGVIAFLILENTTRTRPSRRADTDSDASPSTTPSPATASAAPPTQPGPRAARAPDSSAHGLLANVNSWGYQLQNLNVANAAASPFDLLVVDYAKDGADDTALTPAELERLKTKPDGGRRVMLAYLSIGEAEDYRSYWEPTWKHQRPTWLLAENKEWKGNYAVCFWDKGWQSIVCGSPQSRIDRLIAAGFDGVYLDKCDVFEDLKRKHRPEAAARPDIEADMVAFVQHMSAYAKARQPGFLVIMQNAETLLTSPALRAAIDGIAKEELVFGQDSPEKRNAKSDYDDTRQNLDLLAREGKPVFVVEYLNAPEKIQAAIAATQPHGYILYVAPKDRALKKLNYEILQA
jgi:cysteinyl-tRNA synthetase, unknown class